MATVTSVKSGNWNVTSTWNTGTVPVNGDSVVIAEGHEVCFNVDQSGFVNGLASLEINGILYWNNSNITCLKMNGNITGTGALYIAHRATVTGWTLSTGYTHVYEVATSVWVMEVEETLGAGYGLDAGEELVELAIDTENAARRAQGLNEMMPDTVQDFIETTRAALELSDYLAYVEATAGSFYCDQAGGKTYIHTSDGSDPAGKTITLIDCIQRPAPGSEYRAYLLFNSTGTIAMTGTPVIRMYGRYPAREWAQLAADAATGQNQIVLEHDLGLQAGDSLGIGVGSQDYISSETGACVYKVSDYDSGTKTVTLTTNLLSDRLEGDYVVIVNRPIQLKRSSGSTAIINSIDNGRVRGLYVLSTFVVRMGTVQGDNVTSSTYMSGWDLRHCTGSARFVGAIKDSYIRDINHVNGSPCLLVCEESDVKRIICINTSMTQYMNGAVYDSIVQNNGPCFYPAIASHFYNCIFKNIGTGMGWGGDFHNCEFIGDDYLDIDALQPSKFHDCEFTPRTHGLFGNLQGKLFNCKFNGDYDVGYYQLPKRPSYAIIESFDHNQLPGNYKAWMKGGRIETALDVTTILPGRLILTCESEDYPVFRDFPVTLVAYRNMWWWASVLKDFNGGTVKMELIDPARDPLIDPSAQPLASYTLEDVKDVLTALKLNYRSNRNMQAILRVSAQNSTGAVQVNTRLIEKRVKYGR